MKMLILLAILFGFTFPAMGNEVSDGASVGLDFPNKKEVFSVSGMEIKKSINEESHLSSEVVESMRVDEWEADELFDPFIEVSGELGSSLDVVDKGTTDKLRDPARTEEDSFSDTP